MQNYRFGEIVLLKFPFVEQQEAKRRPALVLLDAGDADILASRITSQDVYTEFDVVLDDWRQSGLLIPSVIRLHKMATLEKRLVERKLGVLMHKEMLNVQAKLQQIWMSI
jgi:mRNA interferase MazF